MSITESSLNEKVSKKKQSWSKSMESNGFRKSINVRETDNNGYIIELNVSGNFPRKDDPTKKEWNSKSTEYISKKNPLATEDDNFDKSMKAMEELVSDNVEFNNV